MKKERPCKTPQCPRKRFGTSTLCRDHFYARKREKVLESLERRKKSKKYQAKERKTVKNKLDRVVSLIVRSRGTCERCGRDKTQVQLQNSHIYSRANLAVRYSLENCKCLCATCHRWWHQNPKDGVDWLKTVRTEGELERLKQAANSVKKWTNAELKALLEDLNGKWKIIQEEYNHVTY